MNERIVEGKDFDNNNNQEKLEFIEEENEPATEGKNQIVRGDNFSIVDSKANNTEGREAQFIHINQVIEKMVGDKKTTEDAINKAEFHARPIAKSATDPELNRVRDAMRRVETKYSPRILPTGFRKVFEQVGVDIQRRPDNYTDRVETKIFEHIALRTCRRHKDTKKTEEAKLF